MPSWIGIFLRAAHVSQDLVTGADIGRFYRAIALREDNDFHWFWIGSHQAYNRLLGRVK